jgi:hypothetical protein
MQILMDTEAPLIDDTQRCRARNRRTAERGSMKATKITREGEAATPKSTPGSASAPEAEGPRRPLPRAAGAHAHGQRRLHQ